MQEPNPIYIEQVSRVIALLQGKWTVQILCAMRERPKRLSELRRAILAASKKALTASLRSLETAQIVLRRDLSSSVLHVEYEIADTIREPLAALLDQLAEWAVHTVKTECQETLQKPTFRQCLARASDILNADALIRSGAVSLVAPEAELVQRKIIYFTQGWHCAILSSVDVSWASQEPHPFHS